MQETKASISPRNSFEFKVAAAVEEVLTIPDIGVMDNFFELGGTSLQAMILHAKLDSLIARDRFFDIMAENPTIAAIAAEIGKCGVAPAESETLTQLSHAPGGPELVFAHAVGGTIMFYHELARALRGVASFYGLQATGLRDGETPLSSISMMAEQYVTTLQRRELSFENTYLGGFSFGCLTALQMAFELEKAGIKPKGLLLIAPPPVTEPMDHISSIEARVKIRAAELLAAFVNYEKISVASGLEARLISLYEANLTAAYSFKAPRVSCPIYLFIPQLDYEQRGNELADGWKALTDTSRSEVFTGDHTGIVRAPVVSQLAGSMSRIVNSSSK